MSKKDDKLPPDIPPPAGQRKPPRRRAADWGLKSESEPETEASIERDDLGNAVWKLHIKSPRRRKDDGEIDPLDVLDIDELSLADDESPRSKRKSFNPYDKS